MRKLRNIAGALLFLASWGTFAGSYEDMIQAMSIDDEQTVGELLKRGMDADTAVPPDGDTLLMLAAKGGKPEMVRTVLAARPKVNARNRHGETALMKAAFYGHLDAVRQLLERGAQVNHDGWTPLIYAATQNRLEIARLLVSKGAQVNAQSPSGVSALMMAAREGHLGMVLLLMENGADTNLENEDGLTALKMAREREQKDIVSLLVRAGAKE